MFFRNISFCIGALFAGLYYIVDKGCDLFLLRLTLGIVIILFFIYYIYGLYDNKKLFLNWARPSNLLLLGLLIVNFQTIANVCLGLAPFSTYLRTNEYTPYSNKVLLLSASCFIGIISGLSSKVRPFAIKKNNSQFCKSELNFWVFLSFVFLSLFISTIDLYSFISGIDYIGSGAADRVIKDSSYFEQLLNCSIIIVLALHVKKLSVLTEKIKIKKFLSSFPFLFLFVVSVYLLLRLLSGDRGPVIYTLCAFMYSYWMLSHKKISLMKISALVLIAAFSITLLGVVRDMDKDVSFIDRIANANSMMSKDEIPSICSPTQELANSINCNFIAVKDINEDKTDYKLGAYNIIAIIGSIPGSSFVLSKVFGVNLRDFMTSEYVTVSYFGPYYPLGLGTTAVTDFYLDFGAIVSFLLFFLCGLLYKRMDYLYTKQNISQVSIYVILLILKISSISIYTSRFSFAGTLSSAIYVMVLFFIMHNFFQKNEYFKVN